MLRRIVMSMGNTYFRGGNLRMARMAGKAEEPQRHDKLEPEPEYQHYKSVDEIEHGEQNEPPKRWMINDHLSASDEINQRGIEQRAKEWGVPIEQLEKLKPWEHDPAKSTNTYKQTVLQGTPPSSIQHRESEGFTYNDLASGTKQSATMEKASDIKNTDKDTTRAQVDKTTKDQGLTADDEIKRRGIEQRAKEWGIPIEKLEELKPWEHHPAQSNPEAYKKTILKGQEGKGKEKGGQGMTYQSQKQFSQQKDTFKSGSKFNDLASGTKQWDGKLEADRKYTDKEATAPTGVNTIHQNPQAEKFSSEHRAELKSKTDQAEVKNAQNASDFFDQSMVDRAMSWVRDKFGGSGSTGKEGKDRMEGPMGDHNALNKGQDNHTEAVHKATFTKYEDSERPFSSSVEEGQKKTSKKEKVKDYLNQQ